MREAIGTRASKVWIGQGAMAMNDIRLPNRGSYKSGGYLGSMDSADDATSSYVTG